MTTEGGVPKGIHEVITGNGSESKRTRQRQRQRQRRRQRWGKEERRKGSRGEEVGLCGDWDYKHIT